MTDWVIRAHSLSRRFGEKVAVDHLDLQIPRGEVFGFLGPNGAGKTTTVRLLNGILTPSGGTAQVLGHDPIAQGAEVRQRAGVLTESPGLYEQLSGRENLLLFGSLYNIPADELPRRVDDILARFGLEERADDKVGGYSKGMKQRLAIARALIHAPELLYLDEPTSGLDPAAARQVNELIAQLSREEGRTVFLCTHNLVEAQRLCDRVGVIDRGRLIAIGSPDELASQLWRGIWVEIDLGKCLTPSLVELLSGMPGVLEVRSDGSRLELQMEHSDVTPEVVRAIVGAGGPIYRVAPREYSLEDVYFQLQGERMDSEDQL